MTLGFCPSEINLNISRLNFLMKRHRLMKELKKKLKIYEHIYAGSERIKKDILCKQ